MAEDLSPIVAWMTAEDVSYMTEAEFAEVWDKLRIVAWNRGQRVKAEREKVNQPSPTYARDPRLNPIGGVRS